MSHKISALIVTALILIDIAISVTALFPYNYRTNIILQNVQNEKENEYRIVYTTMISFFILVQISICFYILKDAWSRKIFIDKKISPIEFA
jgi:hypothetical protein